MRLKYDPKQVAEYEATRWHATDLGNLDDVFNAHALFLQSHFGLSEKIAEELTKIRRQAGKARQETKQATNFYEIKAAKEAVVYHLTQYYTRLKEVINHGIKYDPSGLAEAEIDWYEKYHKRDLEGLAEAAKDLRLEQFGVEISDESAECFVNAALEYMSFKRELDLGNKEKAGVHLEQARELMKKHYEDVVAKLEK